MGWTFAKGGGVLGLSFARGGGPLVLTFATVRGGGAFLGGSCGGVAGRELCGGIAGGPPSSGSEVAATFVSVFCTSFLETEKIPAAPVGSISFLCHSLRVVSDWPDARSMANVASRCCDGRLALTIKRPLCSYANVTSTGVDAGRSGGRSRMVHFPIGVELFPLSSPPSMIFTTTLL